MFNNIDLNNPDLMVDLSTVTEAKKIYDMLRTNGVSKKYCYALLYRKNLMSYDIIKIGESCPEPASTTSPAVGERLTRQVAWLDGWPKYPRSPHGNELRFNMLEEINKGKLPSDVLHKDKITIAVWNLDIRVPNTVITKDKDITHWTEGELARQYKVTHDNTLPVLNYKDPTSNKVFKKGGVRKSLLDSFMTFE